MKPLIGITVNYVTSDKPGLEAGVGGKGQLWHMLANDYVTAVCASGGLPVLLPVLMTQEQSDHYLERLDGILFSGGNDINPQTYGGAVDQAVGNIEPERDLQELHLMRLALERTIPILGICRGTQLLNVAAGGTLRQDIDTEKYGYHFCEKQFMRTPVHRVTTKENTQIREIAGTHFAVNSFHHQCVDQCGPGIEVTAQDSHGIPECIEMPKRNAFTLGLQWHPEGMALTDESNRKIFDHFIIAAAEARDR